MQGGRERVFDRDAGPARPRLGLGPLRSTSYPTTSCRGCAIESRAARIGRARRTDPDRTQVSTARRSAAPRPGFAKCAQEVCNELRTTAPTGGLFAMPRRVNIMMDDDAWRIIEKLPRGTRSRTVNSAILDWSRVVARRDAAASMDALRARLPAIATDEVVRWIREERERPSS